MNSTTKDVTMVSRALTRTKLISSLGKNGGDKKHSPASKRTRLSPEDQSGLETNAISKIDEPTSKSTGTCLLPEDGSTLKMDKSVSIGGLYLNP